MAMESQSSKNIIFLIGEIKHKLTGSKLPSNGEVLSVFFYYLRKKNFNISQSANLVVGECLVFWKKARIPTKSTSSCVKKLTALYQVWRNLQKNSKRTQEHFKKREQDFSKSMDNLFDIAQADAMQLIKNEEDKIFLQRQREPGRPGDIAVLDKCEEGYSSSSSSS